MGFILIGVLLFVYGVIASEDIREWISVGRQTVKDWSNMKERR